MILGIGVDICDVDRFDRLSNDEAFINRIFTDKEIEYCCRFRKKAECFAARFAAKEAFLKAMGTGISHGIAFKEIEVIKKDSGKPEFVIHGETLNTYNKTGGTEIHLSISHEKSAAVAFVIITKG